MFDIRNAIFSSFSLYFTVFTFLYPSLFPSLFLLISIFILLSLSHSLAFSVSLLSSPLVTLLSVCTCSSKEFLVIARKCGSITRYSLPHLNTENTYNVRSEPFRWNQEICLPADSPVTPMRQRHVADNSRIRLSWERVRSCVN